MLIDNVKNAINIINNQENHVFKLIHLFPTASKIHQLLSEIFFIMDFGLHLI